MDKLKKEFKEYKLLEDYYNEYERIWMLDLPFSYIKVEHKIYLDELQNSLGFARYKVVRAQKDLINTIVKEFPIIIKILNWFEGKLNKILQPKQG